MDSDNYAEISLTGILYDMYCNICIRRDTCSKRCNLYKREYNKEIYRRNRSYSIKIEKQKRDCRNNNLDPNSSHGIGYVTEVLVSKFLGIPICFEVTDNFCYPGHDMLEHKDWGLINQFSTKVDHCD